MIRMRPTALPNAQQRAEGRAFLKKELQRLAMSKPVGKVLDSKIGKAGVKVGNTVKKIVKWPAKQLEKEWRGEDEHVENFRRKYGDKSY